MGIHNLSSYGNAMVIVPNNSVDIFDVSAAPISGQSQPTRGISAIYVGGVGTIKVALASGNIVSFIAVPTGTILPVNAVRVFSTGTGATNLIALW